MIRSAAPFLAMFALAALAATSARAPHASASMVKAAKNFLQALSPAQRKKALFPFDSDLRYDWHYVPRERAGLTLKEMDEAQRKLAQALLKSGLSQKGYLKATTIISLENVLRDLEGGRGPTRDPELYTFALWGTPSETETWGWRVEGHHISLNFTLVKGHLLATTPQFLGSNPARVMDGPMKDTEPLKVEEDLSRKLVKSFNAEQRKVAVLDTKAPADIITGAARKADLLTPKGIPFTQFTDAQKKMILGLLAEYAHAMPDDLAKERMDKLEKAGVDHLHFAWAGGLEPGEGHYYRIQGPTFLVEFDNTQNNANHIHTVWRDFNGDWGEDLLLEHYQHGHHSAAHSH